MLSADALTYLRTRLLSAMAYAAYVADGTEYTVPILSSVLQNDGRMEITLNLDNATTQGTTITEVRLYNADGILYASVDETITQGSDAEGILYRFTILLEESN